MKISFIIAILFYSLSTFSQQELKVYTVSEIDYPIENVLVYNLNNNTFNYSDPSGETILNYTSGKDSTNIRIPGYEPVYLTIEDIFARNNKIFLKPYFEELDQVWITDSKVKGKMLKREMKAKNKYFTELVSSGASLISTYHHKDCSGVLQALTFYIDKTALKKTDSTYLRPLIYLLEGDNKVSLLDTPYAILIDNNQAKDVLINFANSKIPLVKDNTYLFGFEVINRDDRKEKIQIRVGNSKGNYSLLKGNPTSDWTKLSIGKEGFSIDYELYFNSCN
jgi:hypothetical protein